MSLVKSIQMHEATTKLRYIIKSTTPKDQSAKTERQHLQVDKQFQESSIN